MIKISFLILILLLVSCKKIEDKKTDKIQFFSFWNMGTSLSVKYISEKKDIKLENDVIDYIKNFDKENSFYKKESYISKLNDSFNSFIKVPKYFCELIKLSINYSISTGYRFDITYKGKIRTKDRLMGVITDCENNQIKTLKGIVIDTGGIAKGYSIDRVGELIRKHNYKNFLVNFGGDILLCGSKNGKNWRVGIKDPYSDKYLKIISKNMINKKIIDKYGCYSVATSGDYERYLVKQGEKHSHIIDSKTGESIKGAHSITVIAKNATLSDTMATAISVGYKDKQFIKNMIKKYNLKVYTLTDKNLKIKEY